MTTTARAVRHHFEQGVLRDSGLTWTGFVTLWVLWIWGAMQTRWLAEEVDVNRSTLSPDPPSYLRLIISGT